MSYAVADFSTAVSCECRAGTDVPRNDLATRSGDSGISEDGILSAFAERREDSGGVIYCSLDNSRSIGGRLYLSIQHGLRSSGFSFLDRSSVCSCIGGGFRSRGVSSGLGLGSSLHLSIDYRFRGSFIGPLLRGGGGGSSSYSFRSSGISVCLSPGRSIGSSFCLSINRGLGCGSVGFFLGNGSSVCSCIGGGFRSRGVSSGLGLGSSPHLSIDYRFRGSIVDLLLRRGSSSCISYGFRRSGISGGVGLGGSIGSSLYLSINCGLHSSGLHSSGISSGFRRSGVSGCLRGSSVGFFLGDGSSIRGSFRNILNRNHWVDYRSNDGRDNSRTRII